MHESILSLSREIFKVVALYDSDLYCDSLSIVVTYSPSILNS